MSFNTWGSFNVWSETGNSTTVSFSTKKPTVLASITNNVVVNIAACAFSAKKPTALASIQNGDDVVRFNSQTNYSQPFLSTNFSQPYKPTNYEQV